VSHSPQLDVNLLISEARTIVNRVARQSHLSVTSDALIAVDELCIRQLPALQQAANNGIFDLNAWKAGADRRAQEVAAKLTARSQRSVTNKQDIFDEITGDWLVYPCR